MTINAAAQFAVEQHKDDTYGDHPYFHHLSQVVRVLQWAGITDDRTLMAAWLHDVVEDTDVDNDTIRAMFGERVAKIVKGCTSCEGNRKTRTAHILNNMKASGYDIPFEVMIVKMADRIANMENSRDCRPDLYKMYRSEVGEFYEACLNGADAVLNRQFRTAWLLLHKRLAES